MQSPTQRRPAGVSASLFILLILTAAFGGCSPVTQRSGAPKDRSSQGDRILLGGPGTNLLFVAPGGNDANPGTLAEPLASLGAARDRVRAISAGMNSDIHVYLRGGRYELADPLDLDERDSGQNGYRVIYEAYGNEQPVLSGGRQIQGWTALSDGTLSAPVGSLRFRQLYVNGVRANRTKSDEFKTVYWSEQNKQIAVRVPGIAPARLQAWAAQGVEVNVIRSWGQHLFHLGGVYMPADNGDAVIWPRSSEIPLIFVPGFEGLRLAGQTFRFENARDLIRNEGDFFLDATAGQVIYKPRTGETAANITAYAPNASALITVLGAQNSVHHLTFRGLTFEHTNWNLPSSEGLENLQAAFNFRLENGTARASLAPAAVIVQRASHVDFDGNTFRRLGAGGLMYTSAVSDSAITRNTFVDIAGDGLILNTDSQTPSTRIEFERSGAVQPIALVYGAYTDRLTATDNYIAQVGQDYIGAVGIYASWGTFLNISHNEIYDTPYTGISVGWGWTDAERSFLGDNTISHNRIHRVMKVGEDGGGIYLQGEQRGTTVSENYVFDLWTSPYALGYLPPGETQRIYGPLGIYPDNGSCYFSIFNNVLFAPIPYHAQDLGLPAHDLLEYDNLKNVAGSYRMDTGVRGAQLAAPKMIGSYEGVAFTARSSVSFAWQPVPGASRYLIRVRDATSGDLIIYDDSWTEPNITIPVAPGHAYNLWLHAATPDFSYSAPSTYSTAGGWNFSVARFARPEVLSPAENGQYTSGTRSVTVSWEAVPFATKYLVRMKDQTTGQIVVYEDNVRQPALTVPTEPGHAYFFWVHATDERFSYADERTYGDTAIRNFSVAP